MRLGRESRVADRGLSSSVDVNPAILGIRRALGYCAMIPPPQGHLRQNADNLFSFSFLTVDFVAMEQKNPTAWDFQKAPPNFQKAPPFFRPLYAGFPPPCRRIVFLGSVKGCFKYWLPLVVLEISCARVYNIMRNLWTL